MGQIETGRIRIVIGRKYPLEQVREAIAYSEAGKTKEKVVVKTLVSRIR
jgi:NADPH:quinone reductase-like Zn-dependent oxidoreductase